MRPRAQRAEPRSRPQCGRPCRRPQGRSARYEEHAFDGIQGGPVCRMRYTLYRTQPAEGVGAGRRGLDERGGVEAARGRAREYDEDGFRRHDQEFHDALTAATCNPYLVGLIGNAYILADALRQRDVPSAGDSVECATQHVAIAEAVARGDADAAAAATSAHVEKVEQLVLAAFLRAAPATPAGPAGPATAAVTGPIDPGGSRPGGSRPDG